jgi:hypothetical protein
MTENSVLSRYLTNEALFDTSQSRGGAFKKKFKITFI